MPSPCAATALHMYAPMFVVEVWTLVRAVAVEDVRRQAGRRGPSSPRRTPRCAWRSHAAATRRRRCRGARRTRHERARRDRRVASHLGATRVHEEAERLCGRCRWARDATHERPRDHVQALLIATLALGVAVTGAVARGRRGHARPARAARGAAEAGPPDRAPHRRADQPDDAAREARSAHAALRRADEGTPRGGPQAGGRASSARRTRC